MSISPLAKLLGEEVDNNLGEKVKVDRLCGEEKVIGLYFSAQWCPPCRAFTPDLIKFYEDFKSGDRRDQFEIIYIDSDDNECQFKECAKDMPWLNIPFGDKERKVYLTRRFRVHSIPSLVLLDGKTFDVITQHGRDHVVDDPQGCEFPWRPRDPVQVLQEIKLINNQGDHVEFNSLAGNIKGLYFSAHWCPPCKAFTPQLVDVYKRVQETGHKFQVIFVSSDRSTESFQQYFSAMPWLAVPYSEEKKRKELAVLYGVGGIPTLILLDEENYIITRDGRIEVNEDPFGELFPWRPKLVDELTEKHAAKLNEDPCLVLFTDGEDKELETTHNLLIPVAEEYRTRAQKLEAMESRVPILHFFNGGDADICDSVRDFIQLDDQVPLLVIIDIPEGKKYVLEDDVEITSDVIKEFVRNFLAGKLVPYPIRT